jgi:hypothetical protein
MSKRCSTRRGSVVAANGASVEFVVLYLTNSTLAWTRGT